MAKRVRRRTRPHIEWAKPGGGPLYAIDQWSAGGHAITVVLRALIDGDDADQLRSFIQYLEPTDFIQTEHLIMLRALKEMESKGIPLTMESFTDELAQIDIHCWTQSLILIPKIEALQEDRETTPNLPEMFEVLGRLRVIREGSEYM